MPGPCLAAGARHAKKSRTSKLLYTVLVVLVVLGGMACSTIEPPDQAVKMKRTMEITGYCKCKKCCNWRRTWRGKAVIASGPSKGRKKEVGITASGTKAKPGTIAADTTRYPLGTVMYVPGYGYGRVEDRGSAMKGDKIDLYFKSHKAALKWGRQRREVVIWIPNV
jgi:3D (Asp-Asp-Asp) domain-containing protein